MGKIKKPPRFNSEDDEREFWAAHSSADYIDWSRAKRGHFPDLKPSTRLISIRLPVSLIEELKSRANRDDIPYQTLAKLYLAEKTRETGASPAMKKKHRGILKKTEIA